MNPAPIPFCIAAACLCGVPCRWDGRAAPMESLMALCAAGLALPVCPEVDGGGLAVPRPPCEQRNGRVFTRDGTDVTGAFAEGAAHTLRLALAHGIRLAVLKENSPSCGSTMIYDGGFTGRRIPGRGVTTALLEAHGIRVVSELEFSEDILF